MFVFVWDCVGSLYLDPVGFVTRLFLQQLYSIMCGALLTGGCGSVASPIGGALYACRPVLAVWVREEADEDGHSDKGTSTVTSRERYGASLLAAYAAARVIDATTVASLNRSIDEQSQPPGTESRAGHSGTADSVLCRAVHAKQREVVRSCQIRAGQQSNDVACYERAAVEIGMSLARVTRALACTTGAGPRGDDTWSGWAAGRVLL